MRSLHCRGSWSGPISLAFLVVFGGLVAVAAIRLDRRMTSSIGAQIAAHDAVAPDGLQFVLLVQAQDCQSSLGFLPWLRNRVPATAFRIGRVVHLGPSAELPVVQAWARSTGVTAPVMQADARFHRALTSLAHPSTPWLLGVDAGGAIRLSVGAPRTPRERQALRQLLESAEGVFHNPSPEASDAD